MGLFIEKRLSRAWQFAREKPREPVGVARSIFPADGNASTVALCRNQFGARVAETPRRMADRPVVPTVAPYRCGVIVCLAETCPGFFP